MNILEIRNGNDLGIILKRTLLIEHNAALQDSEIEHNMWCITQAHTAHALITTTEIESFLHKLLNMRQQEIEEKLIKPPIVFYLWFDSMASQLRFNFLSGCHSELPFNCTFRVVVHPREIIATFLGEQVVEEPCNDEPFVLPVFKKCLV